MNLGNRAILLCEYLVDNTSLYSLHLSNNLISGDTISQIKWMVSVGINHEKADVGLQLDTKEDVKVEEKNEEDEDGEQEPIVFEKIINPH